MGVAVGVGGEVEQQHRPPPRSATGFELSRHYDLSTAPCASLPATTQGAALKTAKELVNEIGLSVQPPRGVAIVLTEEPGAQPNWVAAAGIIEAALTDKFSQKVAELRRTDPLVDWAEVDKGQTEARRVVKFSSQATT